MANIQHNPFHKPNPYQIYKYNKFKHPHLTADYSSLSIQNIARPQQFKIIQNNWIFHQNNLSKKVDFNRKMDTSLTQVSQLELKVKISAVNIPLYNNAKPHALDAKLQNPFYRKNLLVNQQQVKNLVQMDVSLYRNKSKSIYNPTQIDNGSKRSSIKLINSNVNNGYGIATNKNSPYDSDEIDLPLNIKNKSPNQYQPNFIRGVQQMIVSQYVGGSPIANNTLTYSKTPDLTERNSEKTNQYADLDPKSITYKNKKYYLNNVNLIFS